MYVCVGLWSIEDGECWMELNPVLGFEGAIHVSIISLLLHLLYTRCITVLILLFQEMDVQDHLVLEAELLLNDLGIYISDIF